MNRKNYNNLRRFNPSRKNNNYPLKGNSTLEQTHILLSLYNYYLRHRTVPNRDIMISWSQRDNQKNKNKDCLQHRLNSPSPRSDFKRTKFELKIPNIEVKVEKEMIHLEDLTKQEFL